jgi:hypothetical protein
MRFTRFSSDGDSVVQERIWLRLQREEQQGPVVKEKLVETHRFANTDAGNARSAGRCRVLAGIDELLLNTAAAA